MNVNGKTALRAAALAASLVIYIGCTSASDAVRQDRVPAPVRVTLTFDDSLKDHLLIAAPLLEKRGISAVSVTAQVFTR